MATSDTKVDLGTAEHNLTYSIPTKNLQNGEKVTFGINHATLAEALGVKSIDTANIHSIELSVDSNAPAAGLSLRHHMDNVNINGDSIGKVNTKDRSTYVEIKDVGGQKVKDVTMYHHVHDALATPTTLKIAPSELEAAATKATLNDPKSFTKHPLAHHLTQLYKWHEMEGNKFKLLTPESVLYGMHKSELNQNNELLQENTDSPRIVTAGDERGESAVYRAIKYNSHKKNFLNGEVTQANRKDVVHEGKPGVLVSKQEYVKIAKKLQTLLQLKSDYSKTDDHGLFVTYVHHSDEPALDTTHVKLHIKRNPLKLHTDDNRAYTTMGDVGKEIGAETIITKGAIVGPSLREQIHGVDATGTHIITPLAAIED
jgi:hypothetical protein